MFLALHNLVEGLYVLSSNVKLVFYCLTLQSHSTSFTISLTFNFYIAYTQVQIHIHTQQLRTGFFVNSSNTSNTLCMFNKPEHDRKCRVKNESHGEPIVVLARKKLPRFCFVMTPPMSSIEDNNVSSFPSWCTSIHSINTQCLQSFLSNSCLTFMN